MIARAFTVVAWLVLAGFAHAQDASQAAAVLDRFHTAAARADSAAYFELMTDNVVFLGTDGTERWQGQAFRDFVSKHFDSGEGWTYLTVDRHITVSEDGESAWFDELLQNDALGTCRGSGVLVKSATGWKIAQYNLSMPVPNAIALQVAAEIASLEEGSVAANKSGNGSTATLYTARPGETSNAGPELAPASVPADTPPPADRYECSKKRFKTNRKAGC